MNFSRQLGSNIKNARTDKEMRQIDLAQKIGAKTGTTICQYEKGIRIPNALVLSRMSDALDVSLDVLVPKVTCEVIDDPNQMKIDELGD